MSSGACDLAGTWQKIQEYHSHFDAKRGLIDERLLGHFCTADGLMVCLVDDHLNVLLVQVILDIAPYWFE